MEQRGAGEVADEPTFTAPWRGRLAERAPDELDAIRRGERLVAAAGRLITQPGGDGFTVQQVVAEAGLSLRAFYRLFEGKDDLLLALVEESHVVMARLLRHHADRFDEPLDRLGSALYFAVDTRQHTSRTYNTALQRFAVRASATAAERSRAARAPVASVVADLVAAAMDAGAVEPGDPEASAFVVMALQSTYSRTVHLGNSLTAAHPGPTALVRACVQALGADVPPGWEDRFAITANEARRSRRLAEKLAVETLRSAS